MQKIIRRKIWPEFFAAVDSGEKPFEVRNDDRLDESFEVGDTLKLEEWDPSTKQYTGKILRREISYVLDLGDTRMGHATVVLGLKRGSQLPDPWNEESAGKILALVEERDRFRDLARQKTTEAEENLVRAVMAERDVARLRAQGITTNETTQP